MDRRKFIKTSSLVAATPIVIGGMNISVNASPLLDNLAKKANAEDKILVLIQLVGGNDGLNTLIPIDQYSNLYKARPNIIIDETKVLKLRDNLGLHPVMTGMKSLWDEGKLAVVQNVSYPYQNFSHFRSTDIWTSASDSNKYVNSGWIGRYLNNLHPEFPENYPNSEYTDPLSITIGSIVSQTCQGPVFTMGMSLNSSSNFIDLNSNPETDLPAGDVGEEVKYLRTVLLQTEEYLDVIQSAASKGNINESLWTNLTDQLSNQLKIVAQLLAGGIKTKIFVCSLGGFDTHSAQIQDTQDTTLGFHANLLANLSNATYAFQKQIEEIGLQDKVVGMTFSEFGRRIISNDSNGTDHGSAAPMFLFGSNLNPGIYGSNPTIDSKVDASVNLEMEYDFRDVYSSVLKDWFEVSNSQLNDVMFKEFEILPIFKTTSSVNNNIANEKLYPNPAYNKTIISFNLQKPSGVSISIYDINGQFVANVFKSYLSNSNHQIEIDLSRIITGTYLVSLELDGKLQKTLQLKVNK